MFRTKIGIAALVVTLGIISSGSVYFWLRARSASGVSDIKPSDVPYVALETRNTNEEESLIVRWQNLPSNTEALQIYRTPQSTERWSLWKIVPIAHGSQVGNMAVVPGGGAGYSFYVAATRGSSGGSTSASQGGSGGGGGEGDEDSPSDPEPIWTSPPIIPTPASAPTPSFQISQSNVWVEITWQDIPSPITALVVSRAEHPSGPWTVFLNKTNPTIPGPYTERIKETAASVPYYYQVILYNGSTSLGTYGPMYVSAL